MEYWEWWRAFVHKILSKRLGEERITIKYGVRFVEIEETSKLVKVFSGDGMEGDLPIGTGWIHSAGRTLHVQNILEPEDLCRIQ